MVFREVKVRSNIGEDEVRALFDTGASRTFIRNDIAKKIGSLVELTRPRIATLGGGENKIKIKSKKASFWKYLSMTTLSPRMPTSQINSHMNLSSVHQRCKNGG